MRVFNWRTWVLPCLLLLQLSLLAGDWAQCQEMSVRSGMVEEGVRWCGAWLSLPMDVRIGERRVSWRTSSSLVSILSFFLRSCDLIQTMMMMMMLKMRRLAMLVLPGLSLVLTIAGQSMFFQDLEEIWSAALGEDELVVRWSGSAGLLITVFSAAFSLIMKGIICVSSRLQHHKEYLRCKEIKDLFLNLPQINKI